jgi:predicted  nucleic acid-binding Zn ribbon protein
MCEVRKEISAATRASRTLCNSTDEDDLQMYYGLCAVEGERMERFHYDHCEQCQKEGW